MNTALDEPEVTVLPLVEFADAWAAHERNQTRLTLAVAHYLSTGEYGEDGALTMAAWLRDHCRMADTDASALVRRAKFLTKFPVVADAAADSTLSSGHVRALQSMVTRATETVFDECAVEHVAAIAPLSVRDAEQACARWREHAEAISDMPEPVVPERQLAYTRAADGTMLGRFVFDQALAAEFETAIDNALTWEGADDTRTFTIRRCDALMDVVAFFNANHAKDGTPRHRAHIELALDADQLGSDPCCATTGDGYPMSTSVTDAFLCDSIIQRFIMNGSVPIDIGHSTRTVPTHMFRAVAKRDGGCRHPGCGRKVSWCEAHHITFWRHGGRTAVDNLVLLCSRHHHLIHRRGWQLKLLPDGTVEFTKPDGTTLSSSPRPRAGPRLKHLKPGPPQPRG